MAGADVSVIDLGLGQQNFQLAAGGYQLFVAEKGAGTEAAAIKNDGLREAHHFLPIAKFLHHQTPAGVIEVS